MDKTEEYKFNIDEVVEVSAAVDETEKTKEQKKSRKKKSKKQEEIIEAAEEVKNEEKTFVPSLEDNTDEAEDEAELKAFHHVDPSDDTLSDEDKIEIEKSKKLFEKYDLPEDPERRLLLTRGKLAIRVLKKRFVRIIAMTLVVAIFLSLFGYVRSFRTSSVIMMLNYEKSVDGLAPNGTRFNISDFKNDEVIDRIIKDAGLEGVVSGEDLRNSISITPITVKKPSTKENFYIPTSFRIVYKQCKGVKRIMSEHMLDIICNSYSQYFYDNYTMNAQILKGDYSGLEDMEYAQIGSYLEMRIEAVSSFLKKRGYESGVFKSKESGETFNSVRKMAENLNNYNLNNYNAFIWEKGVVLNKKVSTNTRLYLNDKNGREKVLHTNEYLIRREVIGYYNDIMSTSILVPTVNNNNFYMARTKTGVDYLASQAESHLKYSKSLEKTITISKDKIAKTEVDTVKANHDKADAMVKDMVNELIKIEKLADQINKEYKAEYAKSYLTFTKTGTSVFDRIPKKKVAVLSFLFMLFAFYVYYLECSYIAKRGRKK